jgi:hypothetical protein
MQTVCLKRIDHVNWKLAWFCHYIEALAKDKVGAEFVVKKDGLTFQLSLGLTEDSPGPSSHLHIQFEADFEADFSVFDKAIPPIEESDGVLYESAERIGIQKARNVEQAKLETQLERVYPSIVGAVNQFFSACKLALLKHALDGRIILRNIQATQSHKGLKVDPFSDSVFLKNSDAEFLFGAFADLNIVSFRGDARIEYSITDQVSGLTCKGSFPGSYGELGVPGRFPEKFDKIQRLIDEGWSIESEIMMESLDFLCSENYRMAVFTAATILELVVIQFWEAMQRKLEVGNREDQKQKFRLERKMKESDCSSHIEKIIRVVLPEFVRQDHIHGGNLDRCVEAWNMRNNRLAHLYGRVSSEESVSVSTREAWDTVTSIWYVVEEIEEIQKGKAG